MTTREYEVRLADGRVLRVLDAGAAGDPAVAFFHGAPGSRLVPEPWLGALRAAGIRLRLGSRAQRRRPHPHCALGPHNLDLASRPPPQLTHTGPPCGMAPLMAAAGACSRVPGRLPYRSR